MVIGLHGVFAAPIEGAFRILEQGSFRYFVLLKGFFGYNYPSSIVDAWAKIGYEFQQTHYRLG